MSNYWQKRTLDELDSAFNSNLNQINSYLAKEYNRCFKEITQQIELLYDEILDSKADGTLLMSDLYKYNTYYNSLNVMNQNLKKLGFKEQKILNNRLTAMYQVVSQITGNSIGFSPKYNQDACKIAVEKIWCQDGKHWSSRIWDNKTKLQATMEKGLMDCVARGLSREELVKAIIQEMNLAKQTGFYQADRLARTELCYIQNQATYDKFQEAGIEEYRILDTSDSRCCDVCKEQASKIYKLSQAQVGVNYPPFHSNCRCAVLAIIN